MFELVGLFQEDFGPDLLSDLAVHILKPCFLAFTQRVTSALQLKRTGSFRVGGRDWLLPLAPDEKRPLIFVPLLC